MDDDYTPDEPSDLEMLRFYDHLAVSLAQLVGEMVDQDLLGPEDVAVMRIMADLGATARGMRDYYLRRVSLRTEPREAVKPAPERAEGQA